MYTFGVVVEFDSEESIMFVLENIKSSYVYIAVSGKR